MRKIFGLLLLSMLTAGCASSGQSGVRERIDASEQNQQVLEARVGHVEDRLDRVENELEQLSRGGKPVPKPTAVEPPPAKVVEIPPVKAVAPAPVKTGRISRNETAPAPPQETGYVELYRPEFVSRPLPASSGGNSAESPEHPPILDLKHSDLLSTAFTNAPTHAGGALSGNAPDAAPHSESMAPVPPPGDISGASDNGPGLEPPQSLSPAPQAPPAPQVSPAPPAPQTGSQKSSYDAALALYYKGEHNRAREAFQSFLRSFPGSALAPNAMYWEGESLYSLGLYDQAIMSFMGVVKKHPKHDKAAASLLKIGYAYERLKDMDQARFYWQILLDDFPKSAPAALARKRMGIA